MKEGGRRGDGDGESERERETEREGEGEGEESITHSLMTVYLNLNVEMTVYMLSFMCSGI